MAKLIRLDGDKPGPLAERLRAFLSERVVGQERAVKDLAAAAEFFQAGFRDSQAPIYVGMLAGPSGVGKTYMAEALAEFFFGDPLAFTKVDCSNFQHESDLSSLLGSPPGYIGYKEPGESSEASRLPLNQWNMDKHDFYRQQKASGNSSAQERQKKLRTLEGKKELLMNLLAALMKHTAAQVAALQNQALNLQKEYEEQEAKRAAVTAAEALAYLCGLQGKKGKKILRAANQRRLAEEILARAKIQAQDVLLKQTEHIRKTNPVILKILEQILRIEEELDDLNQQGQTDYSPDGNYFSIILFDEIEKAHPSLHNILLEISDKGRLVLRNGAVTHFRNSVILLTSNAGSKVIEGILRQSGIGFKSERVKEGKKATAPGEEIYQEVMQEIKKIFSPPFLGRLDNVIVFNPLDRSDCEQILNLQLKKISDSLAKEWRFSVIIKVDAEVKRFIVNEALENPEQGARMIKKKIRKHIMAPLTQMKNNGEIQEGDAIRVQLETAGGKPAVVLQRLPREGEEGHENSSFVS